MGTNYYSRDETHHEKHIGKKNYGWRFLFQTSSDHDVQINSYFKWKIYLLSDKIEIYNEYSDKIKKSDFFMMVESSSEGGEYYLDDPERSRGFYDNQKYFLINLEFS